MGKIIGFTLLALGAGLFTGFLQNFFAPYCSSFTYSIPYLGQWLASQCLLIYTFFSGPFLGAGSYIDIGIAFVGIYMIWKS